ncbi:MAG: recombination protein RecR [Cytophagales bacterium]|nr:recombination protein RecR [Cytophagales bacterium]
MNFPSKLVEDAVYEVSKLPGIGKKSALRLVLHLIKANPTQTKELAKALTTLREGIRYCKHCHSIADKDVCNICENPKRQSGILCVVEDTKGILAIEATNQYFGKYHVLGGVISPIDGVGPSELNITSLVERVEKEEVKEIIFALSSTMEGDTTVHYIAKKLQNQDVKITSIARGVPIGGELEYADELTLGRSILTRTVYNQQ